MKICPLCAEEVRPEARVCRHCRHTFTPEEETKAAVRRGRLALLNLAIAGLVAWAVIDWLANGGVDEIGGTVAALQAWGNEGANQ